MGKLKKGAGARLIQPVIEGKIIRVRYDEDKDAKEMLLEYKVGKEKTQSWFREEELELVETKKGEEL